jgi:hypothetical protein
LLFAPNLLATQALRPTSTERRVSSMSFRFASEAFSCDRLEFDASVVRASVDESTDRDSPAASRTT